MANTNSSEVTSLATVGAELDPGLYDAKPRIFIDRFIYASQPSGDTLTGVTLPAGVRPLAFGLLTDTSTGTATLSIGISGTAAKYRDAATFTTTDQLTFFRKPDTASAILTASETILITTGTAALPSSGNLWLVSVVTRE